ncbi:hypothetical protein BGZ80_004286 [Entomortierella chlamydospora]|uniref:Uncharacterized protein n=1 Tax=Entomortierella chlamydospora TaxID=101097 RepID=A0A9P6N4D7_9FUNG|nr:hypothetical protein BGZ79_008897 [Entomortierella chlamydospora]KAG0024324.1 hypothetical protein BGZ80_004286 [Entomortierella chlamydospora]
MLQLNKDVHRIRDALNTKGRTEFSKWRKPATRFQKIMDDIATVDMELMTILGCREGRPPSMMEVIDSTGLPKAVGPLASERLVDLHVQLLEDYLENSGSTLAIEDSPVIAVKNSPVMVVKNSPAMAVKDSPVMAVKDSPVMAVVNVVPQPRRPTNLRITGNGMLDPSAVENYRIMFVELQQRLRRQGN